jgi:hypothetical protein
VPEPLEAPFRVHVEHKVEGNPTPEGRQRRTTAACGQGQNRHERVVQELAGMLTAARQRVVVADRAAQAEVAVPDDIIGVEIDVGERGSQPQGYGKSPQPRRERKRRSRAGQKVCTFSHA